MIKLGWLLKLTGLELALISDIDMHLFIEKEIRGGISYTTKKHSKATNKYVMMSIKKVNLLCTWMQTIYVVGH